MHNDTTTSKSLELTVRTQNAMADLRDKAVARLTDERGQTNFEYAGILVLVGGIFALIFGLNLDETVKNAIDTAVKKILPGGEAPA